MTLPMIDNAPGVPANYQENELIPPPATQTGPPKSPPPAIHAQQPSSSVAQPLAPAPLAQRLIPRTLPPLPPQQMQPQHIPPQQMVTHQMPPQHIFVVDQRPIQALNRQFEKEMKELSSNNRRIIELPDENPKKSSGKRKRTEKAASEEELGPSDKDVDILDSTPEPKEALSLGGSLDYTQ